MIKLDTLTKAFGHHVVLDEVSLEVRDGELFVLLGGSGSGKSTILRLIAGLLQPDAGRVLLHGQDVTGMPPQQRGTGFVFQNYSIFRHMSVAENIEFGLKIRRVPAAARARKRELLLDLVGLTGLGNRYGDQLSGGQLQRVALARALAYEPSVLLLDEPFGALDVKIRGQLRRGLKDIQRRLGVATILVTHDQEEAFELGDRIGVLERGRLLEVGEPEALYARPRSLAVATFLGGGTVLAGRAQGGRLPLGGLALPVPSGVAHADGDWVAVLARPEQVELSAEPPAGAASPGANGAAGAAGPVVLGKGTVVEQSFGGAQRRLRLRLPRLPGVRQVAPPVPFGEEGMLVDAHLPSEAPVADHELWVSLRDWHVLEAPPARLLVYDTPDSDTAPLALARSLAQRLRAAITILGVARHADAVAPLRAALDDRRRAHGIARAEVKVRLGSRAQQIAVEQQEDFYDLLVLAAGRAGRRPAALAALATRPRDGGLLVDVLEQPETPVLVVKEAREAPKRFLICTAAGEPGKREVHVGGWLARRLDAAVTLLHVTRDRTGWPRVRGHLEQAAATLRGLDVPADVDFRSAASPVEGIVEAARTGGYDVTLQVIARSPGSVLVAPDRWTEAASA